MRINVYAEEITDETEWVSKEVRQEDGELVTFYGIRMFLDSPDSLHHNDDDDDRSAITFWVPWTRSGGNDFRVIRDLLVSLQDQLFAAWFNDDKAKVSLDG